MNAIQACYMGAAIPQFTMLHSTSLDNSQPTTRATVSASGWDTNNNASPAWSHAPTGYAQPFQNAAHTRVNTVGQLATNPKSCPTPASSVVCSDTNDNLSTSKEHPSDTTDTPDTFKYDQYITGDGVLGWEENKDYAAARTQSGIDSKGEATQKRLGAAKPTSKECTQPTKKKPRKKNVAHRRSVSATNRRETNTRELRRRSERKKKISDAIQTMKEIMLHAGVEGCPVDQNGIIQAAVKYMKTLRAQLVSATTQYAQLAKRFATMSNGPVPMLKPLADTGPDLRLVALASMPPLVTMPAMMRCATPSPSSSDSISADNWRDCHVQNPDPEPTRRRQRRKQPPQQEVTANTTSPSFAEEVRQQIHSRNESVGATGFAKLSVDCQRPEHSDPAHRLDTKTVVDEDPCFPLEGLLDFDFLPSSIAVDPNVLQSIDALTSPQKNSLFATPPSSPQLLLPLTAFCTSPPPDL